MFTNNISFLHNKFSEYANSLCFVEVYSTMMQIMLIQ